MGAEGHAGRHGRQGAGRAWTWWQAMAARCGFPNCWPQSRLSQGHALPASADADQSGDAGIRSRKPAPMPWASGWSGWPMPPGRSPRSPRSHGPIWMNWQQKPAKRSTWRRWTGQVLYVDKRNAAQPVEMFCQAGKVGPAYCTGVGKAMLAYLADPTRLRPRSPGRRFHRFTPHTLATPERSAGRTCRRFAQRGHAFDREEHEPGIICCAVPILHPRGPGDGGVVGHIDHRRGQRLRRWRAQRPGSRTSRRESPPRRKAGAFRNRPNGGGTKT